MVTRVIIWASIGWLSASAAVQALAAGPNSASSLSGRPARCAVQSGSIRQAMVQIREPVSRFWG